MSRETSSQDCRKDMKEFWKEHCVEASVKEMMLDENAELLGQREIPEVLSLLPDVTGMDMLELGAGIGRFTGHLVKRGAKSVTAVDFMEKFIRKNRETHGHHPNITFECQDVTKFVFPHNSVDMVFSNWLLMYLSDEEVMGVFANVMNWLKPNGRFFFRESCFHKSGTPLSPGMSNPTNYRSPAEYEAMINSIVQHTGDTVAKFEMVMTQPLTSYIQLKNNPNQICWLFTKEGTQV